MQICKFERITKKEKELLLIAEWRNVNLKFLRSPLPTPISISHQFSWVESITNNKNYYYFIYDFCNDLIGYCGLDKIDYICQTAEISLLINPKKTRQNIGTCAVYFLQKFGFNNLHLNCIYAFVNNVSNNALDFWKKCGFRVDGRLRQKKYCDDQFLDVFSLSILKEEFRNETSN